MRQVADALGIGVVTVWRWVAGTSAAGWRGWRGEAGAEGAVGLTPGCRSGSGSWPRRGSPGRDRRRVRGVGVRGPYRAGPDPGPGARSGRRGCGGRDGGGEHRRRQRRADRGEAAWEQDSCRCCRTRCRGTPSGCWPGSGCSGRARSRCSRRGGGIRWPGCCSRCPPWPAPGCWKRSAARTAGSRTGSTAWRRCWCCWCSWRCCASRAPRAPPGSRPPRWAGCSGWTGRRRSRRSAASSAARLRGESGGLAAGDGPAPRAGRPGRAGALVYRRAHPGLFRHPSGAEDAHRAGSNPRPGRRGNLGHHGRGDSLLVVMAEPSDSLAAQIKKLLLDLRGICGDGATAAVL